MREIRLSSSLGQANADATVREVIRVYEQAFPGQIAAYYVEGSYADQAYLPTSDIDVTIVFRKHFADEDECKAAERLWATSTHTNAKEVDITLVDEDSLQEGIYPTLKLGSRPIYGEDVCSRYPILPLAAWTRERLHAAYWLLMTVYQRPTLLHASLDFPRPTDEFYGYANRVIRLSGGEEVACTRNLVRTTGWAATALLALQAGQYVVRKRDCARLYRQYIADEWSSLLEQISALCREEWHYLIPAEKGARQQLRVLCERTLSFEQHFLMLYKAYLLEQLRSTEQEDVRRAIWVQKQLPIDDEEIIAALQIIRQSGNA